MEIGTEISQKIRSAIKAKLIELGAYVDDELPDYIMVMVANKRSHKQMTDDLSLFLSTNTEKFTAWLHSLLKKLQSINTDQVQSKPKQKEKHKGEKKKQKPSTSDKTGKPDTDKPATETKKDEQKKQKVESKDTEGKISERITSTVQTGDNEPVTEISISENTDEFNEENKASETTAESSKVGKPLPGKKSTKSAISKKSVKSGDGNKSAAESKPQEKLTSGSTVEKESKKASKKKPSSFVAAVKRKYEEEEEEEEYDPLNPAVGNVASVIRGPTRKSSVPKTMQANRSLLMKAVTDAEKSVTTSKKTDVSLTDSSSGMKSDQKQVDLRKRLKTAAGLQLISRTKRKGLEDMTYTIENDMKKPRKSSGEFTEVKYTVKNLPASKILAQKRSEVGPSRMAASALKGISQNVEKRKVQQKTVEEEEEEEEGAERATDSEQYSDKSEVSDEMNESEESEIDDPFGSEVGSEAESEAGSEVGSEMESEAGQEEGSEVGSQSEYSVEEVEIEVTDRASQTAINMRDSSIRTAGTNVLSCDNQSQTNIAELGGQDMTSVKLSKDKLREIDSSLFSLFIDNLLPFEFVENDSFKFFTKTLQPKYHFPKRKKLKSELGMMYNVVKEELEQDLLMSGSYVLTHNSWENMSGKLYDSVSVHFITNDWALKRAIIGTSALDGNNYVDSVAQTMEETRLKWRLPKPVAVVKSTDNEKSVFEILDWKTVSCFGFCVQDIVRGCVEKDEICDFIQRGRDLIHAVQENDQVLDVFEKKKQVLLSSQAQTGQLEMDDGGCNWSKTLDMIIKLTELTPALHAAIMDSDLTNQGVDLRSHLYNFTEQSILESLVKILSPFKTATDILTNTDGLPSIQKVIPTLIKLEKAIEKDGSDSSVIEDVKQQMKDQIQKFLKVNRKIYLLACLVHPQTKQIGFLSQEDRDKARTLLLEEVKLECEKEFGIDRKHNNKNAKFKKEKGKKQSKKQISAMSDKIDEDADEVDDGMKEELSGSESIAKTTDNESGRDKQGSGDNDKGNTETSDKLERKTAPTDNTGSDTTDNSGEIANLSVTLENDWLDDVIRAPEEQKSPEEVAKIELDVYMAEPASSKNPLSWWREKHTLYPRISKVARRILAIPASSLSSDDVYKLTRSVQVIDIRVKPDHVDMMIFLNKNRHLLQ